jgi:PLP dependent protein
MGAISTALQSCHTRMRGACKQAGRDLSSVTLLAVSKTFPDSAIREAWLAGQRCFGESYLQEALGKIQSLADLSIEWHFIGPIQSNKTRSIATHFSWVHGIESEKIAQRLSAQRPIELAPLQVCLQVNVSGEASKHGLSPDDALALAHRVAALPNLTLRGFMTIPEATSDAALLRQRFRTLAALLLSAREEKLEVDTLSMGMSGDMETAIAEGATIVRVGTAIFGARTYPQESS